MDTARTLIYNKLILFVFVHMLIAKSSLNSVCISFFLKCMKNISVIIQIQIPKYMSMFDIASISQNK